MFKTNLLLFGAAFSLVFATLVQAQQEKINDATRIAVISDVHIMAPSLLKQPGTPFKNYVVSARKLLTEGPEVLDSVMRYIDQHHPQVLLICGDLTKDGELSSHHYLVDHYLEPARQRGLRIFVIPGNHDINNPHARAFDGENTPRVPTVSAADFAHIYHNFGYGEAIARDPYSLSYVVQLDKRTRLIAIDACKYEDNDFKRNYCAVSGRIKPSTMNFIRSQALAARMNGCKVIAMMHHGVVRHWVGQERYMREYLVDDWQTVGRKFAQWGIKVVFTGHFHSQDVASAKGLVDVETGSTVSYPQPYRIVHIDEMRQVMHIKSGNIRNISSMAHDSLTLEERTERASETTLNGMASRMMPKSIPSHLRHESLKVLGEAYAMHLGGDEHPSRRFLTERNRVGKQLKKYAPKWASIYYRLSYNLTYDRGMADNDLSMAY